MNRQSLVTWILSLYVSWGVLWSAVHSFTPFSARTQRTIRHPTSPHTLKAASEDKEISTLEVVVFGLGDLRINDHEGLTSAVQACVTDDKRQVLPLFLLDPVKCANFPGSRCYTKDTAVMISSAIESLDRRLKEELGLSLCVMEGRSHECLEQIVKTANNGSVRFHVCDLGPADQSMCYNSFEDVMGMKSNKCDVNAWSSTLREICWNDVGKLPDNFPEFEKKYCKSAVSRPLSVPKVPGTSKFEASLGINGRSLPASSYILDMLVSELFEDMNKDLELRLETDQNSGLCGTHWGGFNDSILDEEDVLYGLEVLAGSENGDEFLKSTWYSSKVKKNPRSLEHAALWWMSNGGNESKNLIDGESMNRFISAPIQLGLVSLRQLWHAKSDEAMLFKPTSPMKVAAEAREWHKLFAAQEIALGGNEGKEFGDIVHKYWRWQGFLCRYAVSKLSEKGSLNPFGVVLIHGFGASGAQFGKNIKEIAKYISSKDSSRHSEVAFAPDLIGFGQCEKPALTYTQYLWEAYTTTFIKEICKGNKYRMGNFIIGGNSIGGYTSMASAADDSMHSPGEKMWVSASGSLGTGQCKGVVLMNSAGRIITKGDENYDRPSIAEITTSGYLKPCSPPPRFVANAFGNGLLWYLRPRIQSICTNLYPTNTEAVDDVLCGGILRDSLDPGAINVMISGSKLPPPRTANDLLNAEFGTMASSSKNLSQGKWTGPVLLAQGMLDPLQKSEERVEGFSSLRSDVVVHPINAGHCPHDELPREVAAAIVDWMCGVLARDGTAMEVEEATV